MRGRRDPDGAVLIGKAIRNPEHGVLLLSDKPAHLTTFGEYAAKMGNKDISALSVPIPKEQFKDFHTYLCTFVARMGLALLKVSMDHDDGQLKTVPLVPFDRHWDDEALAELIGLTAEELDAIRAALPDYHGLLA